MCQGTQLGGPGQNFFILARHIGGRNPLATLTRGHCPLKERMRTDDLEIFPRNTFGPATGGDEGNVPGHHSGSLSILANGNRLWRLKLQDIGQQKHPRRPTITCR